MNFEPRLDMIGAALKDQSRVRILCALMDGRSFTNKELAISANITPQTASFHLKHLKNAGFISSINSGRCIYYRIANLYVAETLEKLAGLSPTDHIDNSKTRHNQSNEILVARSCYNHIAGRLGVLITQRLISLDVLQESNQSLSIGANYVGFFSQIGLNFKKTTGQPNLKLCLDWTERKHHISGTLATEFMTHALNKNWLERTKNNRSLIITSSGYKVFSDIFDISRELIHQTNS